MENLDLYPVCRLHPRDNVLIAEVAVRQITQITENLVARDSIPANHKVAAETIPRGGLIRKYGEVIGRAACRIEAGEHVHTHNVVEGNGWLLSLARAFGFGYQFAVDHPELPAPLEMGRQFMGYDRASGVGTRNYAMVASMGNCSKHVAKQVANALAGSHDLLADFPNVDGIIALTNDGGCGMQTNGFTHRIHERGIAGMLRHPNVFEQHLVIGLGCETALASKLVQDQQLVQLKVPGQTDDLPQFLNIQQNGGVEATIALGRELLHKRILPNANKAKRVQLPFRRLKIALECGSSGPKSGRTANPILGRASELLAAEGLTVILTETTECGGAEHLLTARSKNKAVGKKLLRRLAWWKHYARMFGKSIDHDINLMQRAWRYFQSGTLTDNLSEGNILAGLTTMAEKALGAVMKAGNQVLNNVYDYAETVAESEGFVIMDGPGNDPLATFGQVAGGAQIVAFTTQGGNCSGVVPASMYKICADDSVYKALERDMDFNADTGETIDTCARRLVTALYETSSGLYRTKSELQGIGHEETVLWNPGGQL